MNRTKWFSIHLVSILLMLTIFSLFGQNLCQNLKTSNKAKLVTSTDNQPDDKLTRSCGPGFDLINKSCYKICDNCLNDLKAPCEQCHSNQVCSKNHTLNEKKFPFSVSFCLFLYQCYYPNTLIEPVHYRNVLII